MIDVGAGPAVVMIPGIQGRWEWMRPAVQALARRCRVITFSLAGEPGSSPMLDPSNVFESFVCQVDAALDRAQLARATICGVSFGGLIATRYAARRPHRTQALILVSALGPHWRPDERARLYIRAPRRHAARFFAGALERLGPELRSTFPRRLDRWSFALRSCRSLMTAPVSPRRMSVRAIAAAAEEFSADCHRIAVPTLVITGEKGLDHVVPIETTLEYLKLVPQARSALLAGTGHLGLVTKPERFAALVADFAASSQMTAARDSQDGWAS